MAKNYTPQMERINKKRVHNGKVRRSTPGLEAWRRLIRNKPTLLGMAIIIILILIMIFANFIAPYAYDEPSSAVLEGPSLAHLFGTDKMGRDLFSRCIYGSRWTIPIAVFAVLVALIVGGLLGTIAAYFGGNVDMFIMRFLDIWGSIPGVVLAIAVVACLGQGITVLVIGLSVGAVPNTARTFRSQIFTVVESEYAEASRSLGASHFRVMFTHLLPNAIGPIILAMVNLLGTEVLSVSMLSFIGVGIMPPTPEWGALLNAGQSFIATKPYLTLFPGLFIMIVVLGFNLLGDGLRDALDPKLK